MLSTFKAGAIGAFFAYPPKSFAAERTAIVSH